MNTSLYPMFLNLRDRTCVVIGGGEMAEGKTSELLAAGAKIVLIAPSATPQIAAWAEERTIQWQKRTYETGDLRDAFLVVAIADRETNAAVFHDAEMQHIFCNSVDDIPHCNCYASAVVRRGPLQIAISTAGNSPALAQRLRKEFEEQFREEYGPWVEHLGEQRSLLFQNKTVNSQARRKILHEQASAEAFEAFQTSYREQRNTQASLRSPDGSLKSS